MYKCDQCKIFFCLIITGIGNDEVVDWETRHSSVAGAVVQFS